MSDLSELFARDPLGLTDQDLEAMIAHLREAQAKHDLGVPLVKATPRSPSKKATDLLKDLGLG
jgi:hypothetical protein